MSLTRSELIQDLYSRNVIKVIPNKEKKINVTLDKYIGSGAYGAVFNATVTKYDKDLAAKIFSLSTEHEEEIFMREASAYKLLSICPGCSLHILCMHDYFISRVFDVNKMKWYAVGVVLLELADSDLRKYKSIPDFDIPYIIFSLLLGLNYLHKQGFAHRDIKPDNILRFDLFGDSDTGLSKNGDFLDLYQPGTSLYKIGDLGLLCDHGKDLLAQANKTSVKPSSADKSDHKYIDECRYAGTPLYQSPHSLVNSGLRSTLAQEQKEDIWKLGITLYTIIFKSYPTIDEGWDIDTIENLDDSDMARFLTQKYPRKESSVLSGPNIMLLLSQMIRADADDRLTAEQLLEQFYRRAKFDDYLDTLGLIEILKICDKDEVTRGIMIKNHNKLKYNRELLEKIAYFTGNSDLSIFLQ